MRNGIFSNLFLGLCFTLGFSIVTATIPNSVTFVKAFNGTSFARPVFFAQVPGKDSTYVVLEQQAGNAIIVHPKNGAWVKDTLLHLTVINNQNEMGFIGLAFHPNFTINRKYYVYYSKTFTPTTAGSADCNTNPLVNMNCGMNVLEERVVDSTLIKDAGVAPRQILSITKSAMNHNGGDIAFGPTDGYLYLGTGDGGDPQGDTAGRGQNPDTLLGKFLRIDVDHPASGLQYGIPADNPFVGNTSYRPELYAIGVRNPWRWSFDALTHTIWAGDVGDNTYEEVDTVVKGANLGWGKMEGYVCQPNNAKYTNCSMAGTTLPIAAYPHAGSADTNGTAVIGGFVYRGNPSSPFYGLYFYGDNSPSRVWVLREGSNGRIQERLTLTPSTTTLPGLSAFGTDFLGNLYALGFSASTVTSGFVYQITSPDMQPVTTSIHGTGKAFAPSSLRDISSAELYNLQGRKVSGSETRNGVYVIKQGDNAPALVPLLK